MSRKYLYLSAALIWGIPGIVITIRGVLAYCNQEPAELWWLLLFTVGAMVAFYFIFNKITAKYINRIAIMPDVVHIWNTFSLRGWILVAFMMMLGITLRLISIVPHEFTASFYSGLGPMLILSAIRYMQCFVSSHNHVL